ncbi:MAG: CHAT domain-containing protein [Desulfuromonadales bacterium]|nr:MAG: CHAT domain-containing protein [Desulfuromonadales bacterium]
MTTIKIPGTSDPFAGPGDLTGERLGKMKIDLKNAVRIEAARAAAEPLVVEVAGDDIMEIELEGGIRLFTTVDQYREDFAPGLSREGEAGVLEIPTELPIGAPSRGVGSWILKGLKIFNLDLAGMTAEKIATEVEEKLVPQTGLFRCTSAKAIVPGASGQVPTDRPILVFIHGTASNTDGGFGGLWEPERKKVLDELFRTYGDGIYAFEHRTLTESPIKNAIQLAEALPEGARLHLVSHSRGGLVGELLCFSMREDGRKYFTEEELAHFSDREDQQEELKRLAKVIGEKKFKVERFVRVACPARGTTLASKRLDRWLTIIVNLIGRIPALKASGAYDLLTDFLLAVVKERTDPATLPGLEAMMPDSPLVSLINLPGVRVTADLSVISGDIEADSILGKLKLLIPDLFYRGDHDLVVDTRAMYGGFGRTIKPRFFFDQGPEVDHFSYFRNDQTTRMLIAGLTRPNDSEAGFSPLEPSMREITQRTYRQAGVTQPVVFVIPGIMGSHLAVNGNRVWLDFFDIATGGFRKLKIDQENVTAQAPVAMAYGELIEYLSITHEVITFPFDWRKSILVEAQRLGKEVAARLDDAEKGDQPVSILAHSMGGLVARAMIVECPEVWERITRHTGGRLIMLGTPNGGSHVIPRLLVGQEKILKQLDLLDVTHRQKGLLEIISRYPGVLQMLPATGGGFDFFSPETWDRLKQADGGTWCLPTRDDLEAARAFRQKLDASPIDHDRMLYVAGKAHATPIDIQIGRSDRKEGGITFIATPHGDGRVPWSTGIPPSLRRWYMDAEHGDLAAHSESFPAILQLLQNGDTTLLPSVPPAVERGVPETFSLPADTIDIHPGEEELTSAALGLRHVSKPAVKRAPVKVSVVHGNLAYSHYPVMVGHYQGDTIISAEAYLDRQLGGCMRWRHQLGLYPGPLETVEVFMNPDESATPKGAIVTGLGKVGELTAGSLSRTVTHGALSYAAAVAECRQRSKDKDKAANISTLIIGSGAGGISVEDSVTAILRGVHRANQTLRNSGRKDVVTIEEVQFVELWQDRAVQAALALDRVAQDSELKEHFTCEPMLATVLGGRTRVSFKEEQGWWYRLQVLADEDGALRFSALTGLARAEVALLPTERALVDQFIERAVRTTSAGHEIARTLFEMLLPNRFKEQAPDRGNLVLVLNEEAARYPWELLEDRWGGSANPLALDAGMLRQLETTTFRERVLTASGMSALVVGDPVSSQIPLPGAEAEALMVADVLEKCGFSVQKKIREQSAAIMQALHTDSYRILHLAGHGVYDHVLPCHDRSCDKCGIKHPCEGKRVSGMIIGDGIFLTPAAVEQMRHVPELVFINCCHLGKIEGEKPEEKKTADERRYLHKLAANLASQFINMGVRAVVAAGWAVNDAAAKTFARKFYNELLAGVTFGHAVLGARKETHALHASVNTWGAYQCYGDPDFTLRLTERKTQAEEQQPRFVASADTIAELENLASDAQTASPEKLAVLKERLEAIRKHLPKKWMKQAEINAALGHAFGEVGNFSEAVRFYTDALTAPKGTAHLKDIEQLANLKARWGVEIALGRGEAKADSEGGKSKTPQELIEEAQKHISSLLELGKTVERICLVGSNHKREAIICADPALRKKALSKMSQHYKEAHELSLAEKKEVYPYPLLNWLTADLILGGLGSGELTKDDFGPWLTRVEQAVKAPDTSFWDAIARTDAQFLRHLLARDLEDHREAIVEGYFKAKHRAASPREFRSVCEHLEFLISMLETEGMTEELARQRDTLRVLRDELVGGEVN